MGRLENGQIYIAGCRPKGLGPTIGMFCEKEGARVRYSASPERAPIYRSTVEKKRFWREREGAWEHMQRSGIYDCDVRDGNCIAEMFRAFSSEGVKLTGLIYSVAGGKGAENVLSRNLFQASDEEYMEIFNVTAFGFVRMMREGVAREIFAPNASIIVPSFDVTRTYPGYGGVGPAKAFLEKWAKDFAYQMKGILRVNVLSTGPIASTYSGKAIPNIDVLMNFYEQHVGWTDDSGRSEIEEAAVRLLEPASTTTGKVVYADGGMNDLLNKKPELFESLLGGAYTM